MPTLNCSAMERILRQLGFVRVRQKGSHAFFRDPDGRVATLPIHPGRDLARPLLREILREIDLSPDELADLMRKG